MSVLEFFTSFISIGNTFVINYIIGTILLCISGNLSYFIGVKLGVRSKSGFLIWAIMSFGFYSIFAGIMHFILWLIELKLWVLPIVLGIISIITLATIISIKRKKTMQGDDI